MGSSKHGVRRERRAFSAKFKAEAARLVVERRAADVTLTPVSREQDVRADPLRAWVRQHPDADGTRRPALGESPDRELRRLRREVATLHQGGPSQQRVSVHFAKESR